ncbi:MAG: type I-U CRISPR-associated protein Cas7 [Acidobacteria bacterium]|nr:type I-U CRISPR-associated protein Cas7 [Acidobacteriota bacterium]
MSIDLEPLAKTTRLLFSVELTPIQGERFQPTGFPSLGAATYQTRDGLRLLVESAQSMANRMETTCWDQKRNAPIAILEGISHVTVRRKGEFFTDTMLEAHRLNSPYVMFGKMDRSTLFEQLGSSLNAFEVGPTPSRNKVAEVLLKWDIGSLVHGAFLSAKKGKEKTLAGGRLRLPRAVSAFVEAAGVRVAASGGVKNDHVNPSGDTKSGYGNVPFARDEFTAESILLHVNLDLAQIRGYGLGENAERLLMLLALHRVRNLIDGDMRFRTACDFKIKTGGPVKAARPDGFILPALRDLEAALPAAISACQSQMAHTTVSYDDVLKKGKDGKGKKDDDTPEVDEDGDPEESGE